MPKVPLFFSSGKQRNITGGSAGSISTTTGLTRGASASSVRPILVPDPPPSAGAAIGRSLMTLGATLSNIGQRSAADKKKEDLKKKKEQEYNDRLWVNEEYNIARLQWTRWMDEASKNPSLDIADRLEAEFREFVEDKTQNAVIHDVTREAQDALMERYDDLYVNLLGKSLTIEARKTADVTISRIGTLIQGSMDTAFHTSDPTAVLEDQHALNEQIDLALEAGKITTANADSFKQSVANIAAVVAERMMTSNPDFAETLVKEAPGLSPSTRISLINKINRSRTSVNEKFVALQDQLFKANIAQIRKTGNPNPNFDIDVYTATRGEGHGLNAANEIKVAQEYFVGKSALLGRSLDEMNQVLSATEPKEGDDLYDMRARVHDQLMTFAHQQAQLMDEDPFTYSLQDPVVREIAAQSYEEGIDDNQRSVIMFQLIEASKEFQSRIGIPDGAQSVVPLKEAQSIAARINQSSPESVINEFNNLMSTYGQYYPDVFRDISRLPSGQRIDTSLQIVALHMNKPWVSDFIMASRTPDADFNIPTQDSSDLKKFLDQSKDMNSFQTAIIESNPNLIPYADDFYDAARKYSMALYKGGKARSMKEASKIAIDRIISSEYGFGTSGSDHIPFAIKLNHIDRLSGEPVSLTPRDVRQIEKSLSSVRYAKRHIKVGELDQNQFGIPGQLDSNARMEYIRDSIDRDAYWVTSPDNLGVTLYIPGNGISGEPVLRHDGSTIDLTFTQALEMYRAIQPQGYGVAPPGGAGHSALMGIDF